MSDVSDLEAQLRREPDEWGPWLVYADYLQEQGDVRGTLIVLEHQLATGSPSQPARRVLQRRIDAIMDGHRARWLEGWSRPHTLTIGSRPQRGERGVRTVPLTDKDAGAEPREARTSWEALVAHPEGRLLRELVVLERLRPRDLTWLLESEAVRRLHALHLEFVHLGHAGEVLLRAAPQLCSLTALGLRDSHLGDEGGLALARCEALRGLSWLDLTGTPLGLRAVAELRASLPGCTFVGL
jgi:uncharacterized protein (TIGR02996 family)